MLGKLLSSALSIALPGVGGMIGGLFDSGESKKGTGIGGAAGAMGSALLQGLMDPFSVTDGGGGAGSPESLANLEKVLGKTFYTGSGYIGEDAQQEAQRAKYSLLNVNNADATRRAQNVESTASGLMGAADRSAGLAKLGAQQDMGQVRREGMDTIRAAGGPVAAISKMTSGLGDAAGRSSSNIATQASNAYSQNLGQAGGLYSAADDIRTKDLMTNAQIFDRRAMTPAPQAASLYGTQAQQGQWSQENKLLEDTWGPAKLAAGLGQGSGLGSFLANLFLPAEKKKIDTPGESGYTGQYTGDQILLGMG